MKAGQPVDDLSEQAMLRQVLGLGQGLLNLAQEVYTGAASSQKTILAQRDLIIETVTRLLGGQVCLWLAEDVSRGVFNKLPERFVAGDLEQKPTPPVSALMIRCMETCQACFGENTTCELCWTVDDKPQLAVALVIAIPMLIQDGEGKTTSLLGALQAERPLGPPFSPQEIELLEGLVAQASMALYTSLQIARETWRQEQLSLVQQVSLQIADVRDIDELARRVTSLILQTFNYYYVAIFTLEPGQDVLRFRAGAESARTPSGGHVGEAFSPVLAIHRGQGIIGHVAQTGQEILANDVRLESLYQHHDALPETRAEVALPLKAQDRLLGVLDVQSDQPDDFDETDILVLRTLTGNIGVAIEGARLYGALQQRAVRLQAIYETSSAITSILDQEQLLNDVVNLIQKRFGYSFVHLFTVDLVRRRIDYEAGTETINQAYQERGYTYDLDDSQGLIPWVARHGETVLVNDVTQEPRYLPSPLPPDETLSELVVPMIFGGKVLGVLDVQSDRLNAFGEEDRFLLETLAGNIAVAMRNAHLYRSETWRRRVADSLREVAGLLSADVDLDQVLAAILIELERTLPLDVAAIWLLDSEARWESQQDRMSLHLAAVHGAAAAALELEVGLAPQEVMECNTTALSEGAVEQSITWLLDALKSDHPIVRTPVASFEPLGAALNFPFDYSAIAAPLRVGDQPLGVLTLTHRTAERYGGEAEAITAAFASYAAVAIENARLYEAAHEQAWISTVLLQVAEAAQSFTNLNELLDTVTRITPMLVGVGACLLYVLDDDGTFIPAAASGLNSEQRVEFERWRFVPGDAPALDRLLVDRQPVILDSRETDLRLSSILAADSDSLLVLVPLSSRSEVLGAFLVEYSLDQPGSVTRSLETFLDERLAILQGIAHQTAIAVDNIRLLKSQKEEAYVSVALLQVAQAVVSSNELQEVLGSIVRITPILVGVERAVIYIWDESYKLFRLAQAYGLPRNAGEHPFAPGNFPLLDAVYHQDRLLACPIQVEEADSIEPLESWSHLPVPDWSSVNDYLENEVCLLLAFPLSVKGKVLGALLVEEPPPMPIEAFSGGNANLRLRAKRMEIITGISQQAALAIQNDQLQREMVERERLERELQLAREIQRSFLPQTIPNIPGWDLKVFWRTAREVGGDFYDIFVLPGKRLGLVIADVADKGMPAALFMTLVRTLVRASVQRTNSPAEVLKRVNHLLVPDATRGMFVTIVYAILHMETGELDYANAGHTPPLLLRSQTCQLERILRTGMALGVQERNRIEELHFVIDPGDFLIMYTDGLTEAFSPDGNMYDEARLRKVIEQTALSKSDESGFTSLTAQEMLQEIDGSLEVFTGGAALSDDMTLLILKNSPHSS